MIQLFSLLSIAAIMKRKFIQRVTIRVTISRRRRVPVMLAAENIIVLRSRLMANKGYVIVYLKVSNFKFFGGSKYYYFFRAKRNRNEILLLVIYCPQLSQDLVLKFKKKTLVQILLNHSRM